MNRFNGHIGHVGDIESPWGNAGGVVKSIEDVEAMSKTGVGWIEAGSFTPEARRGGEWDDSSQTFAYTKPWDYNSETGEMHNALKLPNAGWLAVVQDIPEMVKVAHAHDKPLIVNVAPTGNDYLEETLMMVYGAYAAGADAVLLNIGCPSIEDEEGNVRKLLGNDPAAFYKFTRDLSDRGLPEKIMLRASPQGSLYRARAFLSAVRSSELFSAVFHTNSWPVEMPINSDGEPLLDVPTERVGKSGPAMAEQGANETRWAGIVLRGSGIDVVSSSGISNAEELYRRLNWAVAGSGSTLYFTAENSAKEVTDRMLTDLAAI